MNSQSNLSNDIAVPVLRGDWDHWVLVAIALTGILCYCAGLLMYRRRRRDARPWLWFTPDNLAPFSSSWLIQLNAGVVYTCIIMLGSAAIMIAYPWSGRENASQMRVITEIAFEFPGAFFIFATSVFAATTVINTISLLHRRIYEVFSFRQLEYVIDTLIDENPGRARHRDANETFFIDYVPVIGAFSDEKSYLTIINKLTKWVRSRPSLTHCLFLAPTDFVANEYRIDGIIAGDRVGYMEKGVEDMVLRAKEGNEAREKYKLMIDASNNSYEDWDATNCAIWFSDRVNFEHYMVGMESAFAYYITPDENFRGTRNRIAGSQQTEAMHVSYLREVCLTYLRQAVTPLRVTTEPADQGEEKGWRSELEFKVGQRRVAALEIHLFDENQRPLMELTGGSAILPIAGDLLPVKHSVWTRCPPAWIQVRMTKIPRTGGVQGIGSPLSFFVRVGRQAAEDEISEVGAQAPELAHV